MTNKANLLVVDDEPVERQTLTDILRLEGYHVAAVANGTAILVNTKKPNIRTLICFCRFFIY